MSATATFTLTASCTPGPVSAHNAWAATTTARWARSLHNQRHRPKFAESPDETDVVDATNLAREHDRVEPAAALAGAQQCLIRIESRPRARGYRSNDGGGGGAVRMVVLYDDGRPGL